MYNLGMKKSHIIFLLSPGILCVLLFAADAAFKFDAFDIAAAILVGGGAYSALVASIHLVLCQLGKGGGYPILALLPFASLLGGIAVCFSLMFLIGMYSIIFKGEFM